MCSRYSLTSPPEAIRALFGYKANHVFPPRYNIAPTQPVAIVRQAHAGERELALVRWGLIPGWVKDPATFTTLINARSETALEKPSFRSAMRHRRCLVPADAFYEWTGKPGAKRPHMIRARSGVPMAFAALWEHWQSADGSEMESMAILTVSANQKVSIVHDRMPAILAPEHFSEWLNVRDVRDTEVYPLLQPAPEDLLETIEVSPKLNNPRNDSVEVQTPVAPTTLF
jgi:putative SOS response-associated peptidase YedK